MDKKSEEKTGKNFGFLATRLTLRIYVPQRSKAMLGGLTLTDGFHCHGSRNTKNGKMEKITKASWVTVSQEMVFTVKVWVGSWNGCHILGIRNI